MPDPGRIEPYAIRRARSLVCDRRNGEAVTVTAGELRQLLDQADDALKPPLGEALVAAWAQIAQLEKRLATGVDRTAVALRQARWEARAADARARRAERRLAVLHATLARILKATADA